MRLYSNVGSVSQTVRSGNGPYIARNHARPALLTVFSTTQLDPSITQCDSCHYGFGNVYAPSQNSRDITESVKCRGEESI